MKFWQKAFICVIVCFLICFQITSYMIVRKNYSMSKSNEIATAENEHYVIKKSLTDRMLSVSQYYTNLNPNNIKQYVQPYAQYYEQQKIYIALYQEDTLAYTNFIGDLPQLSEIPFVSGEKYIQFRHISDQQYLLIASYLDISESDFAFLYIKDEGGLVEYWQSIARNVVKIGTTVSVLLSVILIFMLLGLTRPISILNKAAGEIAKGNYQKRVTIKSRDEIGEFSRIFNSMAESIEAHIDKLSYVTEEKQRFIDNLSHEMRTPIAAVLGYGELLKNAGIGQEERLMAIDYIINQSLRLQNLSVKLLQLSSMKEDAIKMEPVHIDRMISRVQDTLCKLIEEKNIIFEINLKAEIIIGDADLLESLFQNFFENAIRVMGQNGKIKIFSEYISYDIRVIIEDNGPGMPQSELQKIFEPFYRVDKARTRNHGGAGLGLSICRQICGIHNAELVINSEPEKGTQVQIYFTTP